MTNKAYNGWLITGLVIAVLVLVITMAVVLRFLIEDDSWRGWTSFIVGYGIGSLAGHIYDIKKRK